VSLYSEYVLERLKWHVYETDEGFITYAINAPEASIEEFYVVPEKRGGKLAKSLADYVCRLAKEAGCVRIWSKVVVGTKGAEFALRTNLHYGFKLSGADSGNIFLVKEL